MRTGQHRPQEGLDRPRWRAKQRHRHDRALAVGSDPHAHLQSWLQARGWTKRGVEALEALDLTAYLRDTAHIDLVPNERLRQLAIALESELLSRDQPRGWLALERIYEFASAVDPKDAELDCTGPIAFMTWEGGPKLLRLTPMSIPLSLSAAEPGDTTCSANSVPFACFKQETESER